MATNFPGSSTQISTARLEATGATMARAAAAVTASAALDEPLPETAPVDRIRLLVQSPGKLYLYWELARDPFMTLRQSIGAAEAGNYKLAARLTNVDHGTVLLREADTKTRADWFEALPGRTYKADIGLFASGRHFIRLLSSNTVHTPRAGVSPLTENAPEFHVAPLEFARVLDQAGYASDALEVALEAIDEQTQDRATNELFGELGASENFAAHNFDVSELRALIVALAFGSPFSSVKPTLSPALARWLEEASAGHSEIFDGARIIELLRSVLQFELSFDSSASVDENTHLAARFVWSASRVNLPELPAHVWLPSMTLRFRRN